MTPSIRLHSFVSAISVVVLASSSVYAAPCTQGARYERKDGAYISIATPSESADGLDRAHFELQSLGNIVAGAPTVGNLEGELTFTRDSCAGFFSSPDIRAPLSLRSMEIERRLTKSATATQVLGRMLTAYISKLSQSH
jgi:hypothetical protein